MEFLLGLKYLPGSFSEVDEVIEISKEASAKGGIYTSHLRDEGLALLDAVNEAILISDKAEYSCGTNPSQSHRQANVGEEA